MTAPTGPVTSVRVGGSVSRDEGGAGGRQRRQYSQKQAQPQGRRGKAKRGREAGSRPEKQRERITEEMGSRQGGDGGARGRRSRTCPGRGKVSAGRQGLNAGGREKGRGRISGPTRERQEARETEAGARERPPFLEPRVRLQGPQRGASVSWGSRGPQEQRRAPPPPAPGGRPAPTGRTHLQRPAPRPHSPRARLLLGRQVNTRRPAAAQRVTAPRRKAPSPPPAPRLPRNCAQSPPSPQPRAPGRPALPHARRPAACPGGGGGGTPCRAGFHRRPQPLLPARPLPGNSVMGPPSSRTRFLTHSTRWETFTLIKATRSAGVEQLINVTES